MNFLAILEYVKIAVEIFFGFGLVILFHEFGHFILAKINGVEAPEFAFGMGPEIAGINYHGTRYKICLFPIGGYVKMVGEEEDEALESGVPKERNFRYKNPLQKISIIFAGPAMNMVLAILLSSAVFMIWGVEREIPVAADKLSGSVVIEFVDPRMPAGYAGIKDGDVITALDGNRVSGYKNVTSYIRAHAENEIVVSVLRNNRPLDIKVKPKINNLKVGEIGVALSPPIPREIAGVESGSLAAAAGLKKGDIILDFNRGSFSEEKYRLPTDNNEFLIYRKGTPDRFTMNISGKAGESLGAIFVPMYKRLGPISAVVFGTEYTVRIIEITKDSIKGMIQRKISSGGVAGPVGIIQYASSQAREGLKNLILLFIYISIGIGILNLFPFPALDGSRIVFHIWEAIIRKPLDPRRESLIHYVGFCVLIAFVILITFRDVRMWIGF